MDNEKRCPINAWRECKKIRCEFYDEQGENCLFKQMASNLKVIKEIQVNNTTV